MMTHHTILLTAGVLLASLGSTLPAGAQPTRIAPSPSVKEVDSSRSGTVDAKAGESRSSSDDAKPTAPSRVRVVGSTAGGRSVGGTSGAAGGEKRVAGGSAAGQAKGAAPADGLGDAAAVPNLEVKIEGSRVILRDLDTDRVLIDTEQGSFWSNFGNKQQKNSWNWAEPTIEVVPRDGGFDVVFNYTNTSGQPAHPGELRVPGVRMPRTFTTRRVNMEGAPEQIVRPGADGKWGNSRVYNYPSQAYAPVQVLSDGEYTIGISLQFPLLDYEHSVNMSYNSPPTSTGKEPFWQPTFRTVMGYGIKSESGGAEGRLLPGESRQYTMSVRVVRDRAGDHPNRWLQTLVPYRDYFQSLYGGVQYERDPRPLMLLSMSNRNQNNNQAQNPRSYNFSSTRAPDKFGFGPWASAMREHMDNGINRFNMVGIAGMQWNQESLNQPFLVATPFFNEPAMALARDSISELQELKADGAQLGFWWGRSAQVMWGWDTGQWAHLDPQNEAHRQAAMAEIDAASQMGAGLMGLDAFKHLASWDAYEYLLELRSAYPEMEFVVEPMPPDILHTVAGGLIFMNRPKSQQQFAAQGAHVLADFLVPGHETWGLIRSTPFYEQGLAKKGQGVPDAPVRALAEQSAANGYSPVVFGSRDYRNWDINAKASWLASVPADLH